MKTKETTLTTGEKIRKYRKNILGISQTELARRVESLSDIKCTQQTIGDIESNKTRNSRLLPYIAVALEVSLEYLNPKIKELSTLCAQDVNTILFNNKNNSDTNQVDDDFFHKEPATNKKTASSFEQVDDALFYKEPTTNKKTITYLEQDVPIYETIDLIKDGFIITDTPIDFIKRPHVVKLEDAAFGIINRCRTLEPAIRIGNTILIHPRKPPQERDFCLFLNEIDNYYTIGEYICETPKGWTIKNYKPNQEKFLDKDIWKKCLLIIAIFM